MGVKKHVHESVVDDMELVSDGLDGLCSSGDRCYSKASPCSPSLTSCQVFENCISGAPSGDQRSLDRCHLQVVATDIQAGTNPRRSLG